MVSFITAIPANVFSDPYSIVRLFRIRSPAGVFIYGNVLDGEAQLQSLLYAKLIAINNPMFDFLGCNYTEKNMCVLTAGALWGSARRICGDRA